VVRAALAAAVVLVGVWSGTARADSTCGAAASAWAARCGAAEDARVIALHCEPGLLSVMVESEGESLAVDVSARSEAFRRAGRLGLSPIGQFSDWSKTPPGLRSGLDKLARCVERGVDDEVFVTSAGPAPPLEPLRDVARDRLPAPVLPWRLLGALAAAIAAASLLVGAAVRRARRGVRVAAATAGGLVALAAGTFLARRALLPTAFYHQNGQGPTWVGFGLGQPNPYGPGFFELFGLAAASNPGAAEQPVFLLQALLGATAPALVWVVARTVGARPLVAWAAALSVALSPGLGRLAQSESYFAVCAWLLLAAGALLGAAGRGLRALPGDSGPGAGRRRRAAFALAVVGAGLLVAQAAVVQPVAWVPAALLPVVILVARGNMRRRVLLASAAALGIAAIVLVTSGSLMLPIAQHNARWGGQAGRIVERHLAELGEPLRALALVLLAAGLARWEALWGALRGALARPVGAPGQEAPLPHAAVRLVGGVVAAALAAGLGVGVYPLLLLVVVATWKQIRVARWRHLAFRLGAALAVPALGYLPDATLYVSPMIHLGWWALFLAPLAATLVAVLAHAGRGAAGARVVAGGLLVAAVAGGAATLGDVRRLRTDALESLNAERWRAMLPAGAQLAYLRRAGERVADMPVYPSDPRGISVLELSPDELRRADTLGQGREDAYYYRSSLCSTVDGRAACAAIEGHLELELVSAATLPALPSMPHMLYDERAIEVALYRIRGTRR
jgi:hypothetical protein